MSHLAVVVVSAICLYFLIGFICCVIGNITEPQHVDMIVNLALFFLWPLVIVGSTFILTLAFATWLGLEIKKVIK